LEPYELLELVLSFSILRRDVKPYAKRTLLAFGGIRRALEADRQDLEERAGLPPQAALLLKSVGDLWRLARREEVARGRALSSPSEVACFVREELGDRPREVFYVLYLDHRNRVLSCRQVQEGTVDHAAVYPREILKDVLHLNATGVILAHNHPAGSLSPSEADRQLTRQIQDASRAMGVTVHDHLIVTSEGSFSFRQAGLL
jgi:DNA repair protein RadC